MSEASLSNASRPEPLSEHRVVVLLVDDQTFIAEAIRDQLSDLPDIDFHYCSKGIEAVQRAREIRPTVILQDLVMPGIDGLTLVRQFRQSPETKNTPIVVLSSKEAPEVKSRAFSLGANDYLVKLPDKEEIIARIYYHSRAYLNQVERDEAYSALHKSQSQLVDSNRALQAAERLAKIGSWSWHIARDQAIWSDMLYEMFLWDISKPAPRCEELRMIFTPESFEAFREVARQCVALGTSYSVDLEGIRTNGEHFFVNAKGRAARDAADNISSVFGTIHDITEQRKLGEIAQKSAVLEERARIAGDIHDSLAQSFAAIVLQTEIAEELLSGQSLSEPRANIAKARDLARFGLAEARRSALTLRPSHALQGGLINAVKQLSQRTSVKDILACETKIVGEPYRLNPQVEHELFRITQEALNNAVRHAKPSRVVVELHFRQNSMTMTIKDNGIGFPINEVEVTEGFGLVTMRERAEKMGGTFTITGKSGQGTQVVITVFDQHRTTEIPA